MKVSNAILASAFIFFTSCKDDDGSSCQTCNSEVTTPFELCKERNGNAFVNGQDTGVEYAIYLDGLLSEGVSCD